MPILFSAVAQDKIILANHGSCEGNFVEIVQQMLSKIPPKNGKMTYSHGYYLLHYIMENRMFFFCITDKTCQRSRAFLFLNEIKRKFRFTNNTSQFSYILAEEMTRYSDDDSPIVIRKGELVEVNHIGVESSEIILGEKLLLLNNPESLSYSTISFVGETPQQGFPSKGSSVIYLICLAVIVFTLWLLVSSYGPKSLVFIVCVVLVCLKQFTRNNKS